MSTKWRCSECNNENITVRAFVNPNTEEIQSWDWDDVWCLDCDQEVSYWWESIPESKASE